MLLTREHLLTGGLVDLVEIDVQDGHLEVIRPVAILVIDVDQAQELLAEIDLDAVILLVARADVDVPVTEFLLQELLELDDFGVVHSGAPRLCTTGKPH